MTQLPEDDTNSVTRKEMMSRLVVCMGGRAAEERIFGNDNVTSGKVSQCMAIYIYIYILNGCLLL